MEITNEQRVAAGAVALNILVLTVLYANRARLLHWVELALLSLMGKRGRKNPYMEGNYKPVHTEVLEQDLKVEGTMPRALNGVFARTGPNPYFTPTAGYHWFDGDGMVHACRIKDGRVAYCNRWVRTHRLATEKKLGFPAYVKFGDMTGWVGVFISGLNAVKERLGVITRPVPSEVGNGTANTALVFHARRLLALHEGDLPYALRIACNGLIETLGRITFGGAVKHPFTAHPKLDPHTGELFYIGYKVDESAPAVWYSALSPDGAPLFDVRVALPQPIMMHDFAITQDWAILLDVPLVFKPEAMVTKKSLPLVYDSSRGARFGLIPKRPTSGKDVRWFEVEPCMIFHVANAWQEGPDLVKLFACVFQEFNLDINAYKENEVPESHMPRMCELTFNLRTGEATKRRLSPQAGDFPQVPQRLTGQRTRYAYMAGINPKLSTTVFDGVAKLDLAAPPGSDACVGRITHPGGALGGECFFVPSHADHARCDGEDDGYLVTYAHTPGAATSELLVYSAKTMDPRPVARVALPQRVPFGFHAYHMSEADFAAQGTMDSASPGATFEVPAGRTGATLEVPAGVAPR